MIYVWWVEEFVNYVMLIKSYLFNGGWYEYVVKLGNVRRIEGK